MHYYYVHLSVTYIDYSYCGDTFISENLSDVKQNFYRKYNTMNHLAKSDTSVYYDYHAKKDISVYHDYYIEIGTFYTKDDPYEYFNDMGRLSFHKEINMNDIKNNKVNINVVDCLDNE